jgi:hypothetical protein
MKRILFLSVALTFVVGSVLLTTGCYKEVVVAPPPPSEPAYQPVPGSDSPTIASSRPVAVPRKWEIVTLRAMGSGAPRDDLPPGQARLMALRTAKVDGYRNLLEQSYGVRIQGDTTVRDFITQNDVVRSKVDGFVRGAREMSNRTLSDGTVEVELEITLDQFFYDYFVPYMR